jgi:glycosyltransferase involved in cell wall biosynthesis
LPAEPLISVIIPARNEEAFIEAALESVRAQTFPREQLECVVADNGSTDGTVEVASRWASKVGDLAVSIVHAPDPGVGRAKNAGAREARGQILMFLDADSRMTPHLAADVLVHAEQGAPAGSIRVVADSGHPVERGFFALMEIGKVWFGVRSQMLYCRRDLFLAVGGFRPDLQLAEDLEFLDRVKKRVREDGLGNVTHVRSSAIATSPRRLRSRPFHLGMVTMFGRWLLAFAGIGRTRKY